MKKLSKLLAIVLCLAMLLPAAAFADSSDPFTSISLLNGTALTDIEVTENGFTVLNTECNLYTVTVPAGTEEVELTFPESGYFCNILYYDDAGNDLGANYYGFTEGPNTTLSLLDRNNDGDIDVCGFYDDGEMSGYMFYFAVKFVYAAAPSDGSLNDKVAVSADPAAPTVSTASQTITVTVDFTETIDVNAISAENVCVPDGWSVTVQGLGYAGESGTDGTVGVGYDSSLKKIAGGWSSDEDYRHIHGLRLTYTAPANAQGSFTLGCEGLVVGTISGASVINGVNATKSVTIAAPTGYTVTVADGTTGTAEVAIGATVTMNVTVSGKAFNGMQGTVSYNKDLFTLTEASGAAAPDTVSDTGSVALYAPFNDTAYTNGATVATLTFTAKSVDADTVGNFTVTATAGDYPDFLSDAVPATAVGDSVTVKASSPTPAFTVALGKTGSDDYVTGVKLVLVTGDAAGYTYGGNAMFKVPGYGENVFAYLDDTANLTPETAKAKVAVSENDATVLASGSYEVNGYEVSGATKVDFNDAGAAFGCYNKAYALADYVAMYLRADVNRDWKVDITDVSAIMNNYTT